MCKSKRVLSFFFFFFQAEDGIRDGHVTGVQTCALPIYPADDSYPYYLDDNFAPYERSRRINDRLSAMNDITARDMQQLQMDTYSYHAQTVLPKLLGILETSTLSSREQEALGELRDWNYENKGNLTAPSLFAWWWDALEEAIWGDEYDAVNRPMRRPDREQTAGMILADSTARWYDNITTGQTETLDDLVNTSFQQALRQLAAEFGTSRDRWKWGYVNNTAINHLADIPGLGQPQVFTGGGAESINAVQGGHGPSWRMVVELSPQTKGYGIYPGGQSGNPGSPYYDHMIEDWSDGKLYPLWFMKGEPSSKDSVAYSIILR